MKRRDLVAASTAALVLAPIRLSQAQTTSPSTSPSPPPPATPGATPPSTSATSPGAQPFTAQQLDQLLAPVALYPDALLAQTLMAATYPLEVVEAARWSKANPVLKGDAALAAVKDKGWDVSVTSLVAFPQVLAMMNSKLDWTQKVGDAMIAQQSDVAASIQRLRAQAAVGRQPQDHAAADGDDAAARRRRAGGHAGRDRHPADQSRHGLRAGLQSRTGPMARGRIPTIRRPTSRRPTTAGAGTMAAAGVRASVSAWASPWAAPFSAAGTGAAAGAAVGAGAAGADGVAATATPRSTSTARPHHQQFQPQQLSRRPLEPRSGASSWRALSRPRQPRALRPASSRRRPAPGLARQDSAASSGATRVAARRSRRREPGRRKSRRAAKSRAWRRPWRREPRPREQRLERRQSRREVHHEASRGHSHGGHAHVSHASRRRLDRGGGGHGGGHGGRR